MQASDYEKLVEAYLLYDRATLIAPQYLIRVNGVDRYPDVLAVRPKEKTFYLVEVTENRDPTNLAEKVRQYVAGGDRVAEALTHELGLEGDWKVKPWIIVWKDWEAAYGKALGSIECKISRIEDLVSRRGRGTDTLDPKRWGEKKKKSGGEDNVTWGVN